VRHLRLDDGVLVSSNLSKEAQQAKAEASFKRKADQARDGKKAAMEYEAAAIATRAKTEKLRALRLAKEAADQEAEAAAGGTKGKKK
jgi:hypothetical protein